MTSILDTNHAMILAAGYGSRLQPDEGHKILTEVNGTPLFDYHLRNFEQLGVDTVTVVTGYKNEALEESLEAWTLPRKMHLNLAFNPDFDSSNGISVLAGLDEAIDQFGSDDTLPFWLTMSDHLFDPNIFARLKTELGNQTPDYDGMLGVDQKISSIFDLPDANKVNYDEDTDELSGIGKQIDNYNLIDVGFFWCDRGFADALREAKEDKGDCSTSDAVRRLAQKSEFKFWDIGPYLWQDIDTPEAKDYAERLISNGFEI